MTTTQPVTTPNGLRRFDYTQERSFAPRNDGFLMTVKSAFTVKNESDAPQPYYSWMQIEEDGNPTLVYARIHWPASPVSGSLAFAPCPTRKHILEAKTDEITLQPGEEAPVEWAYTLEVARKGSDTLSFGMATDGVTLKIAAPEGVEIVVDPIESADETGDGLWQFNRRFEKEQHIPIRWYPAS